MTPVEVVADALERTDVPPVPFGERRTVTLARIAITALLEAGFRIVREPQYEQDAS